MFPAVVPCELSFLVSPDHLQFLLLTVIFLFCCFPPSASFFYRLVVCFSCGLTIPMFFCFFVSGDPLFSFSFLISLHFLKNTKPFRTNCLEVIVFSQWSDSSILSFFFYSSHCGCVFFVLFFLFCSVLSASLLRFFCSVDPLISLSFFLPCDSSSLCRLFICHQSTLFPNSSNSSRHSPLTDKNIH
jgi:hypothetical protein